MLSTVISFKLIARSSSGVLLGIYIHKAVASDSIIGAPYCRFRCSMLVLYVVIFHWMSILKFRTCYRATKKKKNQGDFDMELHIYLFYGQIFSI